MQPTVNIADVNRTAMLGSHRQLNYLIDACKGNDLKAQLQIYKILYKTMFNLSLGIVKDLVLAEYIMQESFLIAFEKIDSCCGIDSFVSRLKKIVETKSRNILKNR